MYADLYDKGYNYAGWAKGVLKGNTLIGFVCIVLNKHWSLVFIVAIELKMKRYG